MSVNPVSLTILYGTHTGRSGTIGRWVEKAAGERGFRPQLIAMDDYNPRLLTEEKNLLVIVSTHGEGEPPAMAEDFHHFMTGKRVPKLSDLSYSVLALGDHSYSRFCQTGIDLDQALKKAGAKEQQKLVMCDVDFEDDARQWMEEVLATLTAESGQPVSKQPIATDPVSEPLYNRKNPFRARVLEKIRITGRDSDKEVYHVEISLENSGLSYLPGDSLGIVADNPPVLVEQILKELKLAGDTPVRLKNREYRLEAALYHHLEITTLTSEVVGHYALKSGDEKLLAVLRDEDQLNSYLWGHDILDLIHEFPFAMSAQELVDILRVLPARLYSISSSQDFVGDEVHITVSAVRYANGGRNREGAASTFIADRIAVDHEIPVFIEHNAGFRLPDDGRIPVIMVGAGTGVAPFRAFMQQREAQGIKGNSWLFFGDRHFRSDFLYQLEWQKYLGNGTLEQINLAFSRDQPDKIYVQNRLSENQKEIYEWLQKGAHFFLCGDRKQMAKGVQDTLVDIIRIQGGMTAGQAADYFKLLKKQKRFQFDVY